jgi:uncharacterized protein (DUF779 family)
MKRLVFLLSILLLFPIISAVEFDMKEEFSQGETLMAKVSGNFLLPLQKDNVFFYRGHVRMPVEYDIKKIDEEYYIYALLVGKEPRNYSIALENVRYMRGAEMSEEDIIRNFTINNQTADFSINPGFASSTEFSIEVQNLQDWQITIQVSTETSEETSREVYPESVSLRSGQKEDIDFIFETQIPIFKIVELRTGNFTYEIPASIPITEVQVEEIFKFEPATLILSAATDSEIERTIYLYNVGDEEITNITISLSDSLKPYVNISHESVDKLDANSNIPIELIFLSEEEFELEGHIQAKQEGKTVYSQISVKFLTDYIAPEEPIQEYTTQTCAELGYAICDTNEECSGDIVYAKDNACCIGSCKSKETTQTGKIIGIVLLIIVIIVGIWFYKKKYKKAKKPVDLLKVAKGRTHNFSRRNKKNIRKEIKEPERRIEPVTRRVERPATRIVEKPIIKEVEKKVFIERPRPPKHKYVASINTKKYHKESCRLSKLIKEQYKKSDNDIGYFQREGYKPCKVCFKS